MNGMKTHDNHSILLQAVCLLGVRYERWDEQMRGELRFDGLRYCTELDRFGCPIIPQTLLMKLLPKIQGFKNQPPP